MGKYSFLKSTVEGNSAGEVYSYAGAAVTKYHMQDALNNRNLFPPCSEGCRLEIKGSARLVSLEVSLLGL